GDLMIGAALERWGRLDICVAKRMGATTIEVQTGHVAMVSHPDEVAQLIKTAAEAVQAAS
ncbi:MAG TPA: hypothetical protein VJ305_05205, partial [Streptosporangiaceae bacterium]|nr:hypothetical protein [Streptosporangiaceae bacterium]